MAFADIAHRERPAEPWHVVEIRSPSLTIRAPAVVRLKQNVLGESSVGLIATFGDPTAVSGSWLVGGDFTGEFTATKN